VSVTDTRVSFSYVAVGIKDGKCPGDHFHFRGAAREVFKYLRHLSEQSNGFAFPTISTIAKRTKNWKRKERPYTTRQVKNVLKDLEALGVIGKWQRIRRKGQWVGGWQVYPHSFWSKDIGGICELKNWDDFCAPNTGEISPSISPAISPPISPETGSDFTGNFTPLSEIKFDNGLILSELKMQSVC
jgi:hypothetical protein